MNKYAHQLLGEAGDQWEEVNAEDIWAFLRFSITGINKVPALIFIGAVKIFISRQYWAESCETAPIHPTVSPFC